MLNCNLIVWFLLLSYNNDNIINAKMNPLVALSTQLHKSKQNNNNNKKNGKRKKELVGNRKIKSSFSSIINDDHEQQIHSLQQQHQSLPPPPLHLQNNPLLQIPCAVQLMTSDMMSSRKTSLQTFVDTGAQVSVLSVEAAERAGLLQMMDRRYEGQATGVGKCRVLGRLPAGCLIIYLHGEPITKSPAITILEYTHDGVELLLGLDFLRDHGAIMNLRREEMTLLEEDEFSNKREVLIPFIRPKRRTTAAETAAVLSLHNNDNSNNNNKVMSDDSNTHSNNNNNNQSRLLDDPRFCLAADMEDNTKGVDMSGI